MHNLNSGNQFGIDGMFESGISNPSNNTLSGMGSGYETIGFEPSGGNPQTPELSGILDGISDLWDKGTETITSGLDTMFTANVDSYVEDHTPLTAAEKEAVAKEEEAAAAAAAAAAVEGTPQESGAAKLLKNPVVLGAGALLAFALFS